MALPIRHCVSFDTFILMENRRQSNMDSKGCNAPSAMMTGITRRSMAWYRRDDQHAQAAGHRAYHAEPMAFWSGSLLQRPAMPVPVPLAAAATAARCKPLLVDLFAHMADMYPCNHVRTPGLHEQCALSKPKEPTALHVYAEPQYEPLNPSAHLVLLATTVCHVGGGGHERPAAPH